MHNQLGLPFQSWDHYSIQFYILSFLLSYLGRVFGKQSYLSGSCCRETSQGRVGYYGKCYGTCERFPPASPRYGSWGQSLFENAVAFTVCTLIDHTNDVIRMFKSQVWSGFTRQTNVGQLVLANSNWCLWTTQQHVGKLLGKSWLE